MAKQILIVEDDLDIREVLQDALELEGYTTNTAENGLVALKKLRSSPLPSVVLLDMLMPVMNGRDLLNIILGDPKLRQVPVIILSATADSFNSDGAAAFIRKLINLDELIEQLEKYCKVQEPAN